MLYWEDDAERDPAATETMLDFARIWRPLPKIVFSRTLTQVQGTHTRLAQGTPAEELERLKAEPGEGDIGVGGAGLAAELIAAGLVDDFRLFVAPIVLGAGTRYFPPLEHRIPLELVERREFAGGVSTCATAWSERARPRPDGAPDARVLAARRCCGSHELRLVSSDRGDDALPTKPPC